MIKRNKLRLILSSIVILLPMLLGLIADKILPDKVVIHLGLDGKPDGFGDLSVVFYILPTILLVLHWLCIFISVKLDKNAQQSNKTMFKLVFWIIPAISLFTCGMIFTIALDASTRVYSYIMMFMGVMFMIIGNYMPKTTRNVTMGIKIRWALANDENWNATHRFAGKIFFALGFACLIAIPLPSAVFPYVAITIILVGVLLPVIYSYRFYKKHIQSGAYTKEDYQNGYTAVFKHSKAFVIVSVVIVTALLLFVAFLMFTGDIEASVNDTSISVKASYYEDLTLDFEDIDSIEYREDGVPGERIYGYASARLLLGIFRNDELGIYTRYTYAGKAPCIVLTAGKDTYVVSIKDEALLKEIFDKITDKMGWCGLE